MELERALAIVNFVISAAPGPVSIYVADAHGELVAAARRELGDDRAVGTRLEPVQRVGGNRQLLAGKEADRRASLHVQLDLAGAAAERLLLAGVIADWWMAVLGADLPREEHELL